MLYNRNDMKTLILTIGNEVTSGHTVNTNAAFIAELLEEVGLTPDRVVTIRDEPVDLVRDIRQAVKKFGVVIITGGLGPTHDDVTKPALCKVFKAPLVHDPAILKRVKRFFARIDKPMLPVNKGQADVPEGFTALDNKWGTAPGLFYDTGSSLLFSLPGVPREMRGLMKNEVMPILKKKVSGRAISRMVFRTAGIGETGVSELIENTGALNEAEVAFLPKSGRVDVRVTVNDTDETRAKTRLKGVTKKIGKVLAPYVFGKNDITLEQAVGKSLLKQGFTIACAESCTGGMFAGAITSVPGSSRYFLEGAVTYSDSAKMKRLKVKGVTIKKYGAVSEQVAMEMAKGICETSGATVGISATGVAGPSGGSKEKPVGLVYLGLCIDGEVTAQTKNYRFDRVTNQNRTVNDMLTWLYFELKARR